MPNNLQSHKEWTRSEWTNNHYMQSVIEFLSQQRIESFIDAGGCTGEFTNIILESIPSIKSGIILEPIKDNFDFIVNNVSDRRVTVINKALYQTKKNISLGRIDDNVGGWSINWDSALSYVECISLEDVLSLLKVEVDFLKIDIEGAERDILNNSNCIHDIKYIEIEFHDEYLEPENWLKLVSEKLPNHKVKFQGDSWCKQNGFLVHV